MSTTYYEQLSARRIHRGKCPTCGKAITRSRTFTQTVNPWNRNPNGVPKSRAEVRESVEHEADAWVPDFAHCKATP